MTDTQDIESWLKEHKITEVECLVPDMTAVSYTHLTLPTSDLV